MLKFIRKKGHMRKVLWFVASIIVLSFGLLGQNYAVRNAKQVNYAGKIFGKKIALEEYRYNFGQTQMQAMMQYGADFNRIRNMLNLPAQTWDRIILLYEANRRRIRINDEDVIKAIESYPIFQRNGSFDKKIYDDVLRYGFRIRPRDFEEGIRDSLKFAKLFEQETKNITVPEQEIFNEYRLKNEKMQISYALIPWEDFKKSVVLDDNKVKEYFLAHKEEFTQPPMVKVEFIRFNFPQKPVPTPTAEDKTAADKKTATPETKPEEPTVSEEDNRKTFDQARLVMEDLAVNNNLREVAKKHNLTVETSDFFSAEKPDLKNGWPFPLIQEIFQAPAGQIIGPVETKTGFQIIAVRDKKELRIPGFEEATKEAQTAWIRAEAMQLAKAKAEEYAKILQGAIKEKKADFKQAVKDNGLELDQTPLFIRNQYLPKIGLSPEFHKAAFALKEDNRVSDPVRTEKGYGILHLDTFVPVDPKEYEKERQEFSAAFLRDRKNSVFSEFVSRLRIKANLEDHIKDLSLE